MTTASTVTNPRARQASPTRARQGSPARTRQEAPARTRQGTTARAGSASRSRSATASRSATSRTTTSRTGTARGTAARSAPAASRAATAPALPRRNPAPTAAPTARPQLRIVESPAERRRRVLRNRRAAVFGTLITTLAVFTIVAFHVMLAQGQVRLARLQTELSGAERDYQQARYAHAQAASPSRIVAKAAQMGLVTPDKPPVAVAVPGPAPSTESSSSRTLNGYTDVKSSFADGP